MHFQQTKQACNTSHARKEEEQQGTARQLAQEKQEGQESRSQKGADAAASMKGVEQFVTVQITAAGLQAYLTIGYVTWFSN